MKKISAYKLIIFLFAGVLLFGINSCNESLLDDELEENADLKSAKSSKQSYVVVLADADLDIELSKLKGYEEKGSAVKSAVVKILKRAGIPDGEVGHVYSTALQGFSVKIPPGQLKKLQDDPSVKLVEEDITISLKPIIKKKPSPPIPDPDPSQTLPWGIERVGGGIEDNYTGVAWIIDTGIDLDHPDLNVDASRGAYFVRARSANDDNGHGTHVAGTVAAIDNEFGVVGVAPGATVIPIKVLDRKGSGSYSGVIAGVDFVAANGEDGDVANMSLSGPVYEPLDLAVTEAADLGIKFALAAGNESDDANNYSPARTNDDDGNIYTVSAMGTGDIWAYFSNFGNPPVDFCAPGLSILSCYKNGGYATFSGTSMAAPHVAGLLLLGTVQTDGNVSGDPDGNADPIAHN